MRLSAYDEAVQRQIDMGQRLMDEYWDVFRALAK
jgi:hypothetical protein